MPILGTQKLGKTGLTHMCSLKKYELSEGVCHKLNKGIQSATNNTIQGSKYTWIILIIPGHYEPFLIELSYNRGNDGPRKQETAELLRDE